MNRKTCIRCEVSKPFADYYVHSMMADGLLNVCKECVKARVKARSIVKNEEIRAYDRKRWDNPARRVNVYESLRRARAADPRRFAEYVRKSDAKYPERKKARALVSTAVKSGKIVKPKTCSQCRRRKDVRIEAHHTDYAKPFEVTWLCTKCHGQRHRAA